MSFLMHLLHFFIVLFDMGIASCHIQIHPRCSSILLRGWFLCNVHFLRNSSLPEGFEEGFAPGKYLYEEGRITENPAYTPPEPASEPEERATLEERVSDLEEALAMAIYGGEAV